MLNQHTSTLPCSSREMLPWLRTAAFLLLSERTWAVCAAQLRGADGSRGRWQGTQVLQGWEHTVLHPSVRNTNAGRHQPEAEQTAQSLCCLLSGAET